MKIRKEETRIFKKEYYINNADKLKFLSKRYKYKLKDDPEYRKKRNERTRKYKMESPISKVLEDMRKHKISVAKKFYKNPDIREINLGDDKELVDLFIKFRSIAVKIPDLLNYMKNEVNNTKNPVEYADYSINIIENLRGLKNYNQLKRTLMFRVFLKDAEKYSKTFSKYFKNEEGVEFMKRNLPRNNDKRFESENDVKKYLDDLFSVS